MKVGLAQINPRIGDFALNTKKVLEAITEAKAQNLALVAFPELTLTGYPPRDLVDYPEFVDANLAALEKVREAARGITVLVGFIERNTAPVGKPFYNCAAVLQDGKQIAVYRKQLLPYYDIFDEERYFEAGTAPCTFQVAGKKVGVTICEDFWNIDSFVNRPYGVRPLEQLKNEKPDLVVNLSASPFSLGKPLRRIDLFSKGGVQTGAPILFCNQIGGNDEMLFDGCSFALDGQGRLLATGPAFEEGLVVADLSSKATKADPEWPTTDSHWLALALQTGLRDYVKKCGAAKVCLGLSGGIDSSVVAAIAVRALGAAAVKGVGLPTRFTSDGSNDDAAILAKNLGVEYRSVPIEEIFGVYEKTLKGWMKNGPAGLTLENVQPRIRMTLLMALANEDNSYLLNTSNKSEIATGYSTLYGDSAGALAVIGDLTKGQVYDLARFYNRDGELIPKRVLERAPTAELRDNQTDQDTLPPYDVLDPMTNAAIVGAKGVAELKKEFDPKWVDTFARLHRVSEYKRRQLPPLLRVSERAFGLGRRVPAAAKSPFSS